MCTEIRNINQNHTYIEYRLLSPPAPSTRMFVCVCKSGGYGLSRDIFLKKEEEEVNC